MPGAAQERGGSGGAAESRRFEGAQRASRVRLGGSATLLRMHGGMWTYLNYDPSKGTPTFDRATLRRVLRWVRPYRWHVLLMLGLLLAISLVQLIPPLLYGRLINELIPNEQSGGIPLTIQRLNVLAIGLLLVPIASSLLSVWQRYISARIGEGLIYDLRIAAYAHVQRLSLRFFTETRTGDIISRFNNDVVGAQNAVTGTIPNLASNLLGVVTTLAIMFTLDWRLALLSISVLPLFLLPTRRVGRHLRDIRREAAEHSAAMSSQLQESVNVSGALLVRTFGRQDESLRDFDAAASDVRDIGVRRAVVGRWFFLGLGIASAIGTALVYWVGGYLAILGPEAGGIEPGLIVTFAAYLAQLYGPITSLSNVQVELATSLVSFERIFEYLDIPVEIDAPEDPYEPKRVEGRVRFEDVWFSYDPDAAAVLGDGDAAGTAEAEAEAEIEWALNGIDFGIEPGGLVALVGPSGAGKTTIGYLLARLYDPTRGRILLDGHDLREWDPRRLARGVGVVTQESYLFHDTIRANLAFARPDATDAELEAACRAANIHERIAALPEGYDTVVGERGYRLSGGEKQRLAIARVILEDACVLVLDEATSHLDSESESLVQDALARVMRDRSSLVIAHRLSTVRSADEILVLEDGRIVERGRHEELLARAGRYADLYETQFQERVPAPAGEASDLPARGNGL